MSDLPPARAEPPELDCQTCGACCSSKAGIDGGADGHVGLMSSDIDRLPAAYRRMVVHGVLLAAKPAGGDRQVCVALEGAVGGRCTCTIYEHRPEACRELERGSDECLAARHEAGLGGPAARGADLTRTSGSSAPTG